MKGRLLAQLADVFFRDAEAAVDPRYHPDDLEGFSPAREVTLEDVGESRRLALVAQELELRAMFAGFNPLAEDPFESEAELERRRCEEWDRVLP